MKIKKTSIHIAIALAAGLTSLSAAAEQTRVTVTIENLAPAQGTNQTPHWVGFHDGNFDIYNGGTPADFLPIQNDPNRSVERLAEDGNTGPLSDTFNTIATGGVDGTIAGPNGPIAPGEIATQSFVLDSSNPANRYFSYASMVLPSNDFWYANGNPRAHLMFDDQGNFVGSDFIVTNLDILDAGTEVNDEVPANTAFFGQAAPDTGVDENGVILDFGDQSGLVRFRQPSEGGNILADESFSMADFTLNGYPLVKISFTAERLQNDPVIQPAEDFRPFAAIGNLSGDQEVPDAVSTAAFGRGVLVITPQRVKVVNVFRNLDNLQMAHLHLAAAGQNGPVIANLVPESLDLTDPNIQRRITRGLVSNLSAEDLVGPLAGQPLNVLADAIRAGNVYVNIHTTENPAGELRGQLQAR